MTFALATPQPHQNQAMTSPLILSRWLLMAGLVWLWSPPVQADAMRCSELKHALTWLATASLFSPDSEVFTEASINAAVLNHFIDRIDHWKLLFTAADLDRLQAVAGTNLAELMRDPAGAPSCLLHIY